jgi:hypothetical protein
MTKEEKQKEIENTSKIQIGDTTFSGLTDDKMVEAYHYYTDSMKVKYVCIAVCVLLVAIKLLFFVH